MSVLLPVRLGRMQAMLKSALTEILGSSVEIRWAHQEIPRDAGDICRLMLVTPPSMVDAFKDEAIIGDLPTALNYAIQSVTSGRRYTVELNGYSYYHDATGVDTRDTVRNAILAKINADDAEELATASVGAATGELVLTPDVPGGLYLFDFLPSASWKQAVANPNEIIRVITGHREMVVSVACFSHNTSLATSAMALTTKIKAGLDLDTVRTIFRENLLSVWGIGSTVNLTALAGAGFETRAQFDLTLAARSVLTEQIEKIESVEVNLLGQGAEVYPSP